jgi:hypothetical protein
MTIFWLIVILYIVIACGLLRPLAGHLAWEWVKISDRDLYHHEPPDAKHWLGAYLFSGLLLMIWPLVLISFFGSKLIGPIGQEKQHVLRESKRRIKELERELNLN